MADEMDPGQLPRLPRHAAPPWEKNSPESAAPPIAPSRPPTPRRVTTTSPAPMARVDPDDDVEQGPFRRSLPPRSRLTDPADFPKLPSTQPDASTPRESRATREQPSPPREGGRGSILFTVAVVLIAANVVVDAVFVWLALTR